MTRDESARAGESGSSGAEPETTVFPAVHPATGDHADAPGHADGPGGADEPEAELVAPGYFDVYDDVPTVAVPLVRDDLVAPLPPLDPPGLPPQDDRETSAVPVPDVPVTEVRAATEPSGPESVAPEPANLEPSDPEPAGTGPAPDTAASEAAAADPEEPGPPADGMPEPVAPHPVAPEDAVGGPRLVPSELPRQDDAALDFVPASEAPTSVVPALAPRAKATRMGDGSRKQKLGVLAQRHRRRVRLALGAAVVVLAVAAGLIVVDRQHNKDEAHPAGESTASSTTIPVPTTLTLEPSIKPLPTDVPAPSKSGIERALAGVVSNPALGTFSGIVTDAASGEVLWSQDADRPLTPASTTKLLTVSAAMLALPLDHRVPTQVVSGATPDEVTLLAGGDVTLSAAPAGQPTHYLNAPRLDDLVSQVRKAGVQPKSIVVDTHIWSGPALAPGWFPADVAGGFIAPMEPVMLDGARLNPNDEDSPRSQTPALDVGRALARRLGVNPDNVRLGNAPSGASPIARVESAPLRDRLAQLLDRSDNVLAEAVGREVAVKQNATASFAGSAAAVLKVLQSNGFDPAGATLSDTSGLSTDDRLPARLLDAIVAAAAGTKRPDLRPMLDYLPVAGGTGTLADRYGTGDRTGAGWIRAKTGTLSDVNTLAGYVVDRSGRVLTFALMSNGRSSDASRPALDAVGAALRACGCE